MSSSFVNKRIDKNLINRDSEAESATEKNKSEKKKVVSTYMNEQDYNRLAKVCKRKGVSLATQSRMLILEFLEENEK